MVSKIPIIGPLIAPQKPRAPAPPPEQQQAAKTIVQQQAAAQRETEELKQKQEEDEKLRRIGRTGARQLFSAAGGFLGFPQDTLGG